MSLYVLILRHYTKYMLADIYFLFRQVMPKGVPPKGFSSSGAHLSCRLSQTALPTGKTVTYSYDPLARLSGSGIDGVLSSSYTYESPGEGKTTPLVSSVTTNGKETEYTYDAFGNILTITEDGVLQHSYTYDARNQLVGETSGTDSYVYSYDAGGNLVSVQKNGEVIKSYTYGDASWKDLLTAFNGQSITYDAIGNPLSYRGMTLSWAGGRRLASVSKEGLSASYVYNSGGIRTQKTVNGVTTNYYLDGNSILRQVTGNDVLEFFYDANGVLGFYYNNTPYYYLKNLQGDIVGILDANGTQVVSYTYDAWGAPLSVTGTAADTIGQINPFRYRSYYYDNETGFITSIPAIMTRRRVVLLVWMVSMTLIQDCCRTICLHTATTIL